jgi:hypothetical protein
MTKGPWQERQVIKMAMFKFTMFHAVQERFPCAGTGRYECSDNSLSKIQLDMGYALHARELGIVFNHMIGI